MKTDTLTARVAAVNRCNAYANELQPKLAAALAPFMGQKVIKTDGALLQKVRDSLPELPNTVTLSVYRGASGYSLYWVVKTCEAVPPCSCVYAEVSVYAGHLQGQTLEPWDGVQWEPLRTDYTVAEVMQLRKAADEAEKCFRSAESACHPFGRYDN